MAEQARGRKSKRAKKPAPPGKSFVLSGKEAYLWNCYHAVPSDENRNALAEFYLPRLQCVAGTFLKTNPHHEHDTLVQDGMFGLLEAIPKYDIARGVYFWTYAMPRVRGAILDAIRERDWIPRLARLQQSRIDRLSRELERKHGMPPTEQQLADRMKISLASLRKMLRNCRNVMFCSLNYSFFETDSQKQRTLVDLNELQPSPSPSRRSDVQEWWGRILRGLSTQDRLIVLLYYKERLTMRAIGEQLLLSESRVSQIHSQIIAFLKHYRCREEFADILTTHDGFNAI